MREDLHEDVAVLRMAAKLKTRPEHIVGYLHRFWGWVSRNVSPDDGGNCPAGCVIGVPIESVEMILSLPGFLTLMVEAGWLIYEESSSSNGGEPLIQIPKFDRHLSQSAKKRAQDTEKKRGQRTNAGHDVGHEQDKRPAVVPLGAGRNRGPEKRREEKNIKGDNTAGARLSKKTRDEFDRWLSWRAAQTNVLRLDEITAETIEYAFSQAETAHGADHVAACVTNSIERNCRDNVPWWTIRDRDGPPGKARRTKTIPDDF